MKFDVIDVFFFLCQIIIPTTSGVTKNAYCNSVFDVYSEHMCDMQCAITVFKMEPMAGMQIHESLLVIPPPPRTILICIENHKGRQWNIIKYKTMHYSSIPRGFIFSAIQYDIQWPNYSALHQGNDPMCLLFI